MFDLFWMRVAGELSHALDQDLVAEFLPFDSQLDNLLNHAHLHGLLVLAPRVSDTRKSKSRDIERSPLPFVLQTPSQSFRHYSLPRVV